MNTWVAVTGGFLSLLHDSGAKQSGHRALMGGRWGLFGIGSLDLIYQAPLNGGWND